MITHMGVSSLSADGGYAVELPVQALARVLQTPEVALMLVPALGLICCLFPASKGALTQRVAPHAFGVSAVAGPLFWTDSLFTPHSLLTLQMIAWGTQLLPAVVMLGALVSDLWAARRAVSDKAYWGIGALALMTAGWGPSLLIGAGSHPAVAFGSIMAVCGGFYAWLETTSGGRVPGWLCRSHALMTMLGALCSLVPSFAFWGEGIMGLSLLGFVAVGVILLGRAMRLQSLKRSGAAL
ncbi:hypothetical protein AA106555_0771 [Neokomagataea thailandica NBRC 106555]|nr:hypothetical protein AA106555_0771 [Neokomagataea thailandica NBRC 106555]